MPIDVSVSPATVHHLLASIRSKYILIRRWESLSGRKTRKIRKKGKHLVPRCRMYVGWCWADGGVKLLLTLHYILGEWISRGNFRGKKRKWTLFWSWVELGNFSHFYFILLFHFPRSCEGNLEVTGILIAFTFVSMEGILVYVCTVSLNNSRTMNIEWTLLHTMGTTRAIAISGHACK